jgi:hypothetical protein
LRNTALLPALSPTVSVPPVRFKVAALYHCAVPPKVT